MLNSGLRNFDPSKLSEEELYNLIAELEHRIVSFHISMKNQEYMNSLKEALEELRLERKRRINTKEEKNQEKNQEKNEDKSGVVIETDPLMKGIPFKPWPNQFKK